MFICIFCGDAEGDGLVWGIFIPGMFICWGEGLAVGDVLVSGMFIPGILPIWGFMVDGLLRAVRFLRRVCLCIFDIFIPGMLAMLCFFGGFLLLVEVLFFCAPGLLLLIPGMFDMSCCAFASRTPTTSNPATLSKHSVLLITLMMQLLQTLL